MTAQQIHLHSRRSHVISRLQVCYSARQQVNIYRTLGSHFFILNVPPIHKVHDCRYLQLGTKQRLNISCCATILKKKNTGIVNPNCVNGSDTVLAFTTSSFCYYSELTTEYK